MAQLLVWIGSGKEKKGALLGFYWLLGEFEGFLGWFSPLRTIRTNIGSALLALEGCWKKKTYSKD
jgi:hypothetical protein